ncbi:translocation/assembly module TamB domain-containing protein [Galbibacter sp.]|uniref:translocation/assembly module TamB domain-containing protein n=1 Tax=Galbibacter sp. TaxID=2918471 RepID=UPI003A8ECFC4
MLDKKKITKPKWLGILLRIAVVLILLFGILIIFIQSKWGQNLIVSKAVTYIEEKIGTEVSIEKLYLTFSGDLSLEGLYMEDQKGDSLVYAKNLQLSVALMPLIRGTKIHIKNIDWDGLSANVYRDAEGTFNFDYIVEAFASEDTTAVDTTSATVFLIDALALSDIKLRYQDLQQGILADLDLGSLQLEMDVFDLEHMDFDVESLKLGDSKLVYQQNKATAPSTQPAEEDSTTPTLRIQELYLNNIKFNYDLPLEKVSLDLELGNSSLKDGDFNLPEAKIALNSFALENTNITYTNLSSAEVVQDTVIQNAEVPLVWPNYQVDVEEISLVNNKVYYRDSMVAPHQNFNASDLQIEALTLNADHLHYAPKELRAHLENFTFRDAKRFWLKNIAFDLVVEKESATLSGFEFSTSNTRVTGDASIGYTSVDALINNPESALLSLNLPFELDVNDLSYFQPELLENPYINALSTDRLSGKLTSNGSLDSLNIDSFILKWQNSLVSLNGVATSVLDTDKLQVEIPDLDIQSNNDAIYRFIPKEELGLELPDSLQLKGSLSGGLEGVIADLHLNSTQGDVYFAGNFLNSDTIKYAVDLRTQELNLGRIIGDSLLTPVSVSIKSMGGGSSLNDLTASLTSDFDSLRYGGYDLSPLKLVGQITNGKGSVTMVFKDENIDMHTAVDVKLDSVNSIADLVMDVEGANLYKLGLTNKDIRTAFNLSAKFQGSLEDFTLESRLEDGVVIAQNSTYDIGVLELSAGVSENQTSFKINHDIIKGKLNSNVNPQLLRRAIEDYLMGYASDSIVVDSSLVGKNALVDLRLHVKNGPLLNKVLLPGLKSMDTISLVLDFDQSKQTLSAHVDIPHLNYQDNEIDSLKLDVKGAAQVMDLGLDWRAVNAGPIAMGNTGLKAVYKNHNLAVHFQSLDSLTAVVDVHSDVVFKNDSIHLKIRPQGLILNKEPWFIASSNEIMYTTDYIGVRDFDLNHGKQHITLENKDTPQGEVSLRLLFENFDLATVMNLLNPSESLVKGVLNGHLEVDHVFTKTGIQADLNIKEFEAMQLPLGTLSMKALASQANKYTLDLSLKDGYVDFDMRGDYLAMQNDGELDFAIDINEIQMEAVEVLAKEAISKADGYISGHASISGMASNPIYKGEFDFHQLSLTPTTLGTEFKLENEVVSFDNDGFYFNTIKFTDVQGSAFTLDGGIRTEQLSKPSFDLVMTADHFNVLHSTVEENELFYGDVSLSTDLTIKGDVEIPVVRGSLRIDEGSSFTMVVPESELDINQREGVVVFVNKSNTNDILTANQSESQAVKFMEGFDLDVALKVDKNSTLKIIMDKRSGDNLEVTGMGEFSFMMTPNGRMNFSGQYEVEDGHYEASLYNIVKRRFDIAKGSRLTWNGDPLEAQLDLQAIYKVQTSAAALMATQTVGVSEEVMRSYRQELPFMVYLNVDGELLAPELSFQLDMPEESQGALGGNVYGYVQQLNNQEEELNKQVFSLLVLNRFFPSSGSDGSAGGPASIARDNVNNVLSDQLNSFSNKLMGNTGVALNFGLDSYTDYQSETPQERTELDINASKSLFDNRLVIQVGSEVDIQGSSSAEGRNAPVIGNVALEYLITKDGRYRLRGYRKNQFESVVDGELIVTGISLIFSKEFNKFKELWERKMREEFKEDKETKPNTGKQEDTINTESDPKEGPLMDTSEDEAKNR